MLKGASIELTPKSLRFKTGAAASFRRAERFLVKAIKSRIRDQQRDSEGRKLPALSTKNKKLFVSAADPRYRSVVRDAVTKRRKSARTLAKREAARAGLDAAAMEAREAEITRARAKSDARYAGKDYKEVKRKLGKRPVRSGHLTGLMWKNFRGVVKRVDARQRGKLGGSGRASGKSFGKGGGLMLYLTFYKNDPNTKRALKDEEGNYRRTGKTRKIMQRAMRNRDKAYWMQFKSVRSSQERGQNPAGREPDFLIANPSQRELETVRDMVLKGIKGFA